MTRAFSACMALLALAALSGCSVVRKENRHLSRAVEAALWPESTTCRVLAAPVVGPVWTVALAADAVVINPVLNAPRALGTALMVNGLVPTVPLAEIVVFPLRLVVIPLVFVGADVTYCMLPL
jgi:hypothetical protein